MVNIVQQQIQSRPTLKKRGFWLFSRPFCTYKKNLYLGPLRSTSNSSDFFSAIGYYIELSNMESTPNFAKVHGPWWTQIKVFLIQKDPLDNQNPGFCMGWPGLYYLLDSIEHFKSVCIQTRIVEFFW